jgi:SOS-response transcriptional repressor LexA
VIVESQEFVRRIEDSTLSMPALVELLRAVLERGEPFRFEAPGFSMSPFIQDGDLITVAPLSGASPGRGDVVAFLRPGSGKLIVHRVVGKRGNAFLIRGDNAEESDDLVPAENVLGRVTKVERNGRRVRLGLGPERYLIAFLTRRGLLRPLLLWVWPLVRPIVRRLAP